MFRISTIFAASSLGVLSDLAISPHLNESHKEDADGPGASGGNRPYPPINATRGGIQLRQVDKIVSSEVAPKERRDVYWLRATLDAYEVEEIDFSKYVKYLARHNHSRRSNRR